MLDEELFIGELAKAQVQSTAIANNPAKCDEAFDRADDVKAELLHRLLGGGVAERAVTRRQGQVCYCAF